MAASSTGRKTLFVATFLAGCLYVGLRIGQYFAQQMKTRKKEEEIDVKHFPANGNATHVTDDVAAETSVMQSLQPPVSEKPRVPSPTQNLTTADVWTTIRELDESGAGSLDVRQAKVLTALLQPNADPDATAKVLSILANCAAFTSSQNALREAGCLHKVTDLLQSQLAAEEAGLERSEHLVQAICAAINNLSMNADNQEELMANIPMLIELCNKTSNTDVHLSLLQPLTNLCLLQSTHKHYTQYIQHLYELLDSPRPSIVIQALRILVNLSDNAEMVPHLLAAKAPECFLSLLVPDGNEAVLLRWTTFLANVVECVRDNHITVANLPPNGKAASPDTMYNHIYGVDALKLRGKIFALTQCGNPEISQFAQRVHTCLTPPPALEVLPDIVESSKEQEVENRESDSSDATESIEENDQVQNIEEGSGDRQSAATEHQDGES